jgi:LacI family transcriptional regulator, galactose operon repressor
MLGPMVRRERSGGDPTIHHVAREAGVSTATAARVLGRYGHASERTRTRVLAAATRLGYSPNALARSMITGSTQTIGLVIADIENPFFARAARGIADVARTAGFEVIFANSDEDSNKERAAIQILAAKRVDGLIVTPAASDDGQHLDELTRRGTPLVLLDRYLPSVAADAVVINNQAASKHAVQHLTGLGHERIAIVAERSAAATELLARHPHGGAGVGPGPTSAARFAGYLDALRDARISLRKSLVRFSDYRREAAVAQTIAVLSLRYPATAIFTTDNLMTLGVVEGVQRVGLRAPRDVSIVGFDDLEWTTIVDPPLSVIAQPVYEMGSLAAGLLLERIGGSERPPMTHTLEAKLIIRGSTARPPA